jgi:hypothetical protein
MATSLIRIPQPQGGTMYAFASAAKDITRAFNNPDIKFEFSKFALLDLPDFTTPVNGLNTINLTNQVEASGNQYIADSEANVEFAQSFQSYVLNLEELLLQDDDHDPVLLQSDAEKILFKWLSNLGAIRFKSSDSSESTSGTHYTEDLNASNTGLDYERVVKYLGSIDAENDISYKGNTYHEVYINVPSSVGNTPTVLFSPSNYNTTATKVYSENEISGRAGQNHPDPNLTLESIVDIGANANGPYYDINSNATDSVHIDFEPLSYHGIANDTKVSTLNDYAKKGQDFRFNAVLVYYDMFSVSTPVNRATNLYGLLILDNIGGNFGVGSKIHEQIKFKPNAVTGLNGNAFSLKLNLKFNTSLDNVGVETNINDFTTFSMDLFLDTTTALEHATDLLLRANNSYGNLANRLEDLERMVLAGEERDEIVQRLKDLETSFNNASIALQDSDSLLQLITKAHTKLNSLLDGTVPVDLQYNTDVIFNGLGTEIDKSVPSRIKINNSVHGYHNNPVFKWDINASTKVEPRLSTNNTFNPNGDISTGQGSSAYGIWAQLKPFDNRVSLIDKISGDTNDLAGEETPQLGGDLNIYIDDGLVAWKAGQTVKITFETIDVSESDIYIRTGSASNFDKIIGAVIRPSMLLSNKPYFEVVCIDPVNYIFEVDILR